MRLAQWKADHEAVVLGAAGEHLRTAVVRPGTVYGGGSGIVGDLFKSATNGLVRVIGDGNKVTYLANLSAPTPTTRSDGPEKDQRLYLVWQRGALREAAEELASRAKVDPRGKVLAHFCPPELEAQLAELEEKHAAEKGHRRIRRTIFGIEPSDAGGYRFVVVDQQADSP